MADVTFQLVKGLRSQGHSCAMASVYDHFLSEREIKFTFDDSGTPFLRMGRAVDIDLHREELKKLIKSFDPDWISLQFVCYGLHPKGFVYGWGNRLASIAPSIPWEIMFHEIWIGERCCASLKERFIGRIQKYLVVDLVRKIAPRVIHTSNHTYAEILKTINLNPKVLPLIGGVKIPEVIKKEYGNSLLKEKLGLDESFERSEWWWTGIYGALHSNWVAEPLFSKLEKVARSLGKKIAFFHLGRSRGGDEYFTQLREKYDKTDFRIIVKDVRVAGRNTQGVKLINLDMGDVITAVARVVPDDTETEGGEGGEGGDDADSGQLSLAPTE